MDSTTEPDLTLTPASVDCVRVMGRELEEICSLLSVLPGPMAAMAGHVGCGLIAGITALVHEVAALRKALEAGRTGE